MLDWSWLYLMPFFIPAAKKIPPFQTDNSQDNRAWFWTGSIERQTTGKPKTLKHALKVATKPLNTLNPYQKHLKAKVSYYSSGNINFYHHYYSLYGEKNAHYAGIMLNAPTIAIYPKLCRHNISNPTSGEISAGLFSRTAAGSQAKDH